jgi:hypothetical protein
MLIKIPSLIPFGTTWRLYSRIVDSGSKRPLISRSLIASTEASTPNREPVEASESSFCPTYSNSRPVNLWAGCKSAALAAVAQSDACNETERCLPYLIRCHLRPDCLFKRLVPYLVRQVSEDAAIHIPGGRTKTNHGRRQKIGTSNDAKHARFTRCKIISTLPGASFPYLPVTAVSDKTMSRRSD